jgi:hypothetical protein
VTNITGFFYWVKFAYLDIPKCPEDLNDSLLNEVGGIMTEKSKKNGGKLKIVKAAKDKTSKKSRLEPDSQFAKSMNDFCNQLQAQIDAIMRF